MRRRHSDYRDLKLDYDPNEGGEYAFLTLSSPEVLIQIGFEPGELSMLLGIPETDWAERRVIKAGESGGLRAHWHKADPDMGAMVGFGADQESCPINVVLTEATLKNLLALASDPPRE